KFFIIGKKENAIAIRKAHKEFKLIKDNYLQVRGENLRKQTVTSLACIYPKSILIEYYLKNKKLFSMLKWKNQSPNYTFCFHRARFRQVYPVCLCIFFKPSHLFTRIDTGVLFNFLNGKF